MSDTVTVSLMCQECGERAALEMTPEDARKHAHTVLAAATGIDPEALPVAGGEGR